MENLKTCTVCKLKQPLENYSLDRRIKCGRRGNCKDCEHRNYRAQREYFRNYYRDHKEKMKAYTSKYFKSHRTASRLAAKKYRRNNREKVKRYHQSYWFRVLKPKRQAERQKQTVAGRNTPENEVVFNQV